MTIKSHKWMLGDNSVSISQDQAEYSAVAVFESDSKKDTGVSVTEYMQSVNLWFGSHFKVGNDEVKEAFLRSIEAPKLAPGADKTWIVKLNYVNDGQGADGDGGGGGGGSDPLLDPPKISTSTTTRSEPIQKAVYYGGFTAPEFEAGKTLLITNSALMPVVPAPEREVNHRIVRVERNFPTLIADEEHLPTRWVNKDNVILDDPLGLHRVPIKPRCMRSLGWSSTPIITNRHRYVKIVFEGEIRDDTWDEFLKDEGWQVKAKNKPDGRGYVTGSIPEGVAHVRQNIDVFGYPTKSLLNGNGEPLKDGEDPVYGQWNYYRELRVQEIPFFKGMAT
jgi:hypothetical protein